MGAADLSKEVQEAFDIMVGKFEGMHHRATVIYRDIKAEGAWGPNLYSDIYTTTSQVSDPTGINAALYPGVQTAQREGVPTIAEHLASQGITDVPQGTVFYAAIATNSNLPGSYLALLCKTTREPNGMVAILQTNDSDYVRNHETIGGEKVCLDWQQLTPDA